MPFDLTVNGKRQTVDVPGDMPLLWALRDHAGLTGTKYGCGIAQCGACTVHVNGMTLRSCITPVSTVEGSDIVTIEGVSGPETDAVRAAWAEIDVPQCGYCQSGQIMSAADLLKQNPKPTRDQIVEHMSTNICRCGTYQRIIRAVERVAREA